MEASETQYFEVIYSVYIVARFFYTFCSCRVSSEVLQLQHFLHFQDSSYFHIHLQARDYRGSLAFHLLPLLLLGFAGTIYYSSWLCCTDGASAGSTFSFLDYSFATRCMWTIGFTSFSVASTPTSRLCSYAHSTPCSRLWVKSCTSSPTTPSPFLPERYFFTVNARGNHGLLYRSNQFHQVPAKARRGRQRRAGRPRSTEFLLLNTYFLFFSIQLSKVRLVVTNPAVRHGLFSFRLYSLFFNFRSVFSVVWVSPCLFHWVPCIRCKLAAYPEAQCILLVSWTQCPNHRLL